MLIATVANSSKSNIAMRVSTGAGQAPSAAPSILAGSLPLLSYSTHTVASPFHEVLKAVLPDGNWLRPSIFRIIELRMGVGALLLSTVRTIFALLLRMHPATYWSILYQ